MKVVTYATRSEGSFEDLVNNEFGVEVVVLGWGTKWNGFMDKINGVLEYIKTLDDNELVVFVDGFDSYIMKPLDGLQKAFESFDCDILVSKNPNYTHLKYIWNKVYGTCKGVTVNSGLYMGYASSLVPFLNLVKDENSSDDQKNMNKVCKKMSNVKIDTESVILHNINIDEDEKFNSSQSYFLSTPGALSVKRILRAFKEYSQFLIPEIILFFLVIYFLYLQYIRR